MSSVNKHKLFFYQIGGIVLATAADLVIKAAVAKTLPAVSPVVLIKHVLSLTYVENTGAAFSIFSRSTNALSVFTGIVIAAVLAFLFFYKKKLPTVFNICIPLILAGGLGNLIDRIVRGYVVDYIQFTFFTFPVFNFADMMITCSSFVLIIYLLFGIAHGK